MASVTIGDVEIAFDSAGEPGRPAVVLICGCGQPAMAWQIGMVPSLLGAGYRVITFDNRGVAPSSAPPAPYTVDQMAIDTLGLLDHLDIERACLVGHSMGGWIAETLAIREPDRVRAAVLMGSCNRATAWEKAITTVERDLARRDFDLPPLFYATETLRYLPNRELQDDGVVEAWLALIGDQPPWPNPGKLGQYEACLRWSEDEARTKGWASISAPCLVLAFEHDIDSPPARAREAAEQIPGARFAEIPDASHLGPFTHVQAVADIVVEFLAAVVGGS